MKSVYKYKCALVQETEMQYGTVPNVKQATKIIQELIGDEAEENVIVLALDCRGEVIGIHYISHGGISYSLVSMSAIFKRLLANNAASFIMAHNHPSGNVDPSEEDIKITKKVKRAASLMEVPIVDHIIVSDQDYYSFKESRKVL